MLITVELKIGLGLILVLYFLLLVLVYRLGYNGGYSRCVNDNMKKKI